MVDSCIEISDFHTRIPERTKNIRDKPHGGEKYNNNHAKQSRYHTQIFQPANITKIGPVSSDMYVKKNTNDTLRFNLSSLIFDSGFNDKIVSKVNIKKNSDGTVDFIIFFKANIKPEKTIIHYPVNLVCDNYITQKNVNFDC
jgi:hypothetical protein